MPLPVTEPPAQQNKIEDNILHFPLPSDASHSVSISLLGATVISWKANAIEQLYLSPLTVDPNVIQGKKAIRGGILGKRKIFRINTALLEICHGHTIGV